MEENYILPYTWLDIVSFPFIAYCVFVFSLATYLLLKSRICPNGRTSEKAQRQNVTDGLCEAALKPIEPKYVVASALIVFALWLPFFFAYFPGLIMGDSLASVGQATGAGAWNNHHPAAYTFIIFCCIKVTSIFGLGLNAGYATYSLLQMCLMSLCFGYLCVWMTKRCSLPRIWLFALTAYFALTPYIASYSIAMWKDPLFSAAIVMLTLLLMDFILSKGKIVSVNKSWLVMFVISMFAMSLLRSNGVYICMLLSAILAIAWARNREKPERGATSKLFASSLSVTIFVAILTGPIYNVIGIIPAPTAEGAGLLVNQMARVAATGGNMTDEDKAYLNEVLPLEQYEGVYRPSCVDLLKWNPGFDDDALKNGLISHWLSMLMRNPVAYFEAWELETCGYWAINQPTVLANINNLSGGVPHEQELGRIGDNPVVCFFGSDAVKELFPIDEWNIPLSLINWGLVYIAICLILLKRRSWTLSLVPMFGLIITLLIASPIYYWARYEAAGHFLIPYYIALFILLLKSPNDVAHAEEQGLK